MKKNWKIIFGISLLIFLLGYSVYMFINRPYMKLIIKFKDVPPVITSYPRGLADAYYRGYRIGKVSKIALSQDQKYIVFYLDITYKNLKLPKNISIVLGTEDLYGSRHFSFYYPANPSSNFLTNGDTVYGDRAPDRLDKYLVNDLQAGRLKVLVDNLLFLTGYLKGASGDLNKIISRQELRNIIKQLPSDLTSTVRGINAVNVNIPNVNRNIGLTNLEIARVNNNISRVNYNIAKASRDINSASKNIEVADMTISQTNSIIPKTNNNLSRTNSVLSSTNCNLSEVNRKIPEIPPNLLENANTTLENVNCLSYELTKILSKKFLLFRFMFGNPAKSLINCSPQDINCQSNSDNVGDN